MNEAKKGNQMSKLEFATQMQARTKKFAVEVIKFFAKLPKTDEAESEAEELVRIFQTSLKTAKRNAGK